MPVLSATKQGNLEKISVITTLGMMEVCNLLACALEQMVMLTLGICCIHCFGGTKMTVVYLSLGKTSKSFVWKANCFFFL